MNAKKQQPAVRQKKSGRTKAGRESELTNELPAVSYVNKVKWLSCHVTRRLSGQHRRHMFSRVFLRHSVLCSIHSTLVIRLSRFFTQIENERSKKRTCCSLLVNCYHQYGDACLGNACQTTPISVHFAPFSVLIRTNIIIKLMAERICRWIRKWEWKWEINEQWTAHVWPTHNINRIVDEVILWMISFCVSLWPSLTVA